MISHEAKIRIQMYELAAKFIYLTSSQISNFEFLISRYVAARYSLSCQHNSHVMVIHTVKLNESSCHYVRERNAINHINSLVFVCQIMH